MNDELYHYGVLGMKWGQRKAQKRGDAYKYKSHTTKKYEKKAEIHRNYADDLNPKNYTVKLSGQEAAKLQKQYTSEKTKAKIYGDRAKRSAKLDAKEQKQSLSVSTGKTVVSRLFGSALFSKSYQRYRALGDSKARAVLKSGAGNYTLSMVTKARYIRGKGRYAESE